MEVHGGPVLVLSGPELEVLGRQLREAIRRGWGVRQAAPPSALLDLAITLDKLTHGTYGTCGTGYSAGQRAAAEPRNTQGRPAAEVWDQPARTLSVKQAAQAMKVSESYVRRLVRHGSLEVRDGQGPTCVYADSVAAWQEHRRRKENDPKAA